MDIGHSIDLKWLGPSPEQWLVAGPVNGYISVRMHWLALDVTDLELGYRPF